MATFQRTTGGKGLSSHITTRIHAEEQSAREKLEHIIFFVIFKSLLFNNSNAQKKKSKTIATSKSDHTWTSSLRHYWVPASNYHIKLTLAACSASMFKMVEWFIQLPFHPHSALYRFIFIYSFLNFSSLTNFR